MSGFPPRCESRTWSLIGTVFNHFVVERCNVCAPLGYLDESWWELAINKTSRFALHLGSEQKDSKSECQVRR